MEDLEKLVSDIRECRICVDQPMANPLPHEPRPVLRVSPSARLCICGQAPGVRVHKSGRPFTDPSGDRLRSWMGVDADTFYDVKKISIIPMGFCFPGLDQKGGDLPPRKECSRHWHSRLFECLDRLELVLLVGQYAQKWHLREKRKSNLTETVRAWQDYVGSNEKPRFLPLPHPSWRNNAWLGKNPWFEEEIIPFLRKEVQIVLDCTDTT